MKKILIGVFAACLPLCASQAQAPAKKGEWASYGYDAGGGRFSPLTQITPANVDKLQVAWTYHMNPVPSQKLARIPFATTTPLMVDGRMFLGTPYGRVVALEGAEGTDGMLERVAQLRAEGRISQRRKGVLVKLCEPGQDLRADLPSIGLETLRRAQAAGLAGIAVEAGRSLVLERAAMVAEADAQGLFVTGIVPSRME